MTTIHSVATDEVAIAVEVDCDYCGFAGTAEVRSRGTGEAASMVIFDRAHARRVAMERAHEDVLHQARVTAALLPCPRCHRRSRSAVVQYTIMTALGVLGVCAIAAIAWWLQTGFWRWLTTAALLGGAGAIGWRKRARFLHSESLLESVRVRAKLPAATAVSIGAPRPPATAPAAPDVPSLDETGVPAAPKLLR